MRLSGKPIQTALARNADPKAVFVVSGATRGLGLAFAESLLERTKGTVVTLGRSASPIQDTRIHHVTCDLLNQEDIDRVGAAVSEMGRCDMLLNVAAVLGDMKSTPGPERSLASIDRDWMRHSLEMNTIAHVMMTQALLSPLQSTPGAVVGNVSARVGSIGDNRLGGWYSYRMSKAALNMFTKTASNELKRRDIALVSLHPGTVDTSLSEPFQGAVKKDKLFSPSYAAAALLDVVNQIGEENTGGFYDYAGEPIAW